MIREKFGYKKLFDETFEKFKKTAELSKEFDYREKWAEKGLSDVTSYDPLYLPDYYREFYYVPLNERKYKWNYPELDEIRRILDYPYFYEKAKIDDLFAVQKDFWVEKTEEDEIEN